MRLIRLWFCVSDALAWVFVPFFALAAFFVLVFGPLSFVFDRVEVDWVGLSLTSASSAVAAMGCYGVTRRRPSALLAVIAPGVLALWRGATMAGLVYSGAAIFVLGMPFLLVWLEAFAHPERVATRQQVSPANMDSNGDQ